MPSITVWPDSSSRENLVKDKRWLGCGKDTVRLQDLAGYVDHVGARASLNSDPDVTLCQIASCAVHDRILRPLHRIQTHTHTHTHAPFQMIFEGGPT